MNMLSRLAKFRRHPLASLAAGAVLVAAPKCVLCLAGWLGLGTLLGLGGPEICGAPAEQFRLNAALIAIAAITPVGLGCLALRGRHRKEDATSNSSP